MFHWLHLISGKPDDRTGWSVLRVDPEAVAAEVVGCYLSRPCLIDRPLTKWHNHVNCANKSMKVQPVERALAAD